ncbi:MAG: vacuolar-type H+-ATPase subunit H [Oscillospiraceae bacterium]|nr:vacuolar-type H+-ATPase subunit H [Oscillospiraceae bacterium]
MNIEEILEEIDEFIDNSKSVPFATHKKIVDSDRLRELISDVRMNLPKELKEAQKIELEAQKILDEAKKNAEIIIQKAEERASKIVAKEAIVTEARKKAVDMITKAQQTSQNIQKTAMVSITKMLDETEASYNRNLQSIRAVKAKFSETKN